MKGFRPGLVPSLVVAILVPVMVCLGFWQLSRGEQKRVLMANYAERRVAPPMDSVELQQTADPAFRPVQLSGQFDAEHSILLDNRQHDGKVGVELLQPFLDHRTGLWLLVNRGWLPWPDRRTPPTFDTPERAVSLEAWVYVAPGATFQLHADPTNAPWPRLVTAIEPDKLWAELGRSGFAYELRQQNGPGAYRTDWPVVSMGPEKHLGYAVQWFAMATALFGLFLYLGWHNAGRHHGKRHESNQHV